MLCCSLCCTPVAVLCTFTLLYNTLAYYNRNRQTPQGRAWGVSMLGVAAGSLTFHASHGAWRCWGRRFDYWMIATSSSEWGGGGAISSVRRVLHAAWARSAAGGGALTTG